MLLIFEVHGVFLAFFQILIQSFYKGRILDRRHRFGNGFFQRCGSGCDPFVDARAFVCSASFLSADMVGTGTAVAVLFGVFVSAEDDHAVTSRSKVGDRSHELFELSQLVTV